MIQKHRTLLLALYTLTVLGGVLALRGSVSFAYSQIPAPGTPSVREELSVAGGGLSLNAPTSYYSMFSPDPTKFSFVLEKCPFDQTDADLATEACQPTGPNNFTRGNNLYMKLTCTHSAVAITTYSTVSTAAMRGSGTFTVNHSCGAAQGKDSSTGMYKMIVQLCLSTTPDCNNPVGPQLYGFRLYSSASPQTEIGYDGDDSVSFPFAQQYRGASCASVGYSDDGSGSPPRTDCLSSWPITFEGACDNSTTQTGQVKWQDGDGYPSLSPQNWSINFRLTGGGNNITGSGQKTPPAGAVRVGGQGADGPPAGSSPQTVKIPPGNAASDVVTWRWNEVLYSNGIQFWVPANTIAAAIDCGQPPTGSLTLGCNGDGTAYVMVKFNDPDGPTTGTLTVNFAGSTPPNKNYALGSTYDTTGAAVKYNIPEPAANFNGSWGARLTVNNVPSGADLAIPSTTTFVTHGTCVVFTPNCSPGTDFYPPPSGRDPVPGSSYVFHVGTGVAGNDPTIPAGSEFTVTVVNTTTSITPISNAHPAVDGSKTQTGAGGAITHLESNTLSFTPTEGSYTVTWSFTGDATPCTVTIQSGYRPYFTVEGGDMAAGAGFAASGMACATTNATAQIKGEGLDDVGSFYGASSQLGALANGPITLFAADNTNNAASNLGGSTNGIALTDTINPHSPSGLAFANTTTPHPQYGSGLSRSTWCVPDYYGAAPAATGGPFNAAAPVSGVYVYGSSQTFNTPITLNQGVHVTIVVKGDVQINQPIKYNYTSVASNNPADIPEFKLLVQGNIYVAPGVDTLTGFYDAQPGAAGTGTLYTCGSGFAETPGYDTCRATQLTVYGAVASKALKLDRTQGHLRSVGGTANTPAERFVFTPELWMAGLTGLDCTTSTDCTYQGYSNLPPVF
jgi:hypothetical protein